LLASIANHTPIVIPAKAGIHPSGGTMFHVYLLASRPRGTLYLGVTADLVRRVWEHKAKAVPGFTARYGIDRLVWFEAHDAAEPAIRREKQIKEWRRAWKVRLIEDGNPEWVDLYSGIVG
jgi:putative endonuclease